MRHLFRHKEHLVRMAVLFLGGTLLFVILRAVMVPSGFGEYGHYRPGALDDNRSLPIQYAGRTVCADCHPDVVEARAGGKHEAIGCEACHGALAAHAEGRTEDKPAPADHSPAGACTECHMAHSPGLS